MLAMEQSNEANNTAHRMLTESIQLETKLKGGKVQLSHALESNPATMSSCAVVPKTHPVWLSPFGSGVWRQFGWMSRPRRQERGLQDCAPHRSDHCTGSPQCGKGAGCESHGNESWA